MVLAAFILGSLALGAIWLRLAWTTAERVAAELAPLSPAEAPEEHVAPENATSDAA